MIVNKLLTINDCKQRIISKCINNQIVITSSPVADFEDTRLVVKPFWMVKPLTDVWTPPVEIILSISVVDGRLAIVTLTST